MRINRKYLPYIAAFLWLVVGLGLMIRGFLWWQETFSLSLSIFYFVLLVPLAFLFSSKILLRVTRRNLAHIRKLPHKVCVFAFQPARSYGVMFFMIFLGITLRHSPLPRPYLGALYLLMGLSLSIASFHFVK